MAEEKKKKKGNILVKWIFIGIICGMILGLILWIFGVFEIGESGIAVVGSWTIWGLVGGIIVGLLKTYIK